MGMEVGLTGLDPKNQTSPPVSLKKRCFNQPPHPSGHSEQYRSSLLEITMFEAINSMFRMFNQLFVGTEQLANAYVQVTSVAETKAKHYANEERSKLLANVIDAEPKQLTS